MMTTPATNWTGPGPVPRFYVYTFMSGPYQGGSGGGPYQEGSGGGPTPQLQISTFRRLK